MHYKTISRKTYWSRRRIVAYCVMAGIMVSAVYYFFFSEEEIILIDPTPAYLRMNPAQTSYYPKTVNIDVARPKWNKTLHGYWSRATPTGGHDRWPMPSPPLLTKNFAIIPCRCQKFHILSARTGSEMFNVDLSDTSAYSNISTPTYSNGNLYFTHNGFVVAYSMRSRSTLWKGPSGGKVADFLLNGNQIIAVSTESKLYRLNAESGETIGEGDLQVKFKMASDMAMAIDKLVIISGRSIYCVDAKSWNLQWEHSAQDPDLGTPPNVSSPRFRLPCGDDKFVYAGKYIPNLDGKLFSIDIFSGEAVREFTSYSIDPPTLSGNIVLNSHKDGVVAYDRTSGKELWYQGTGNSARCIFVFGDIIYCVGDNRLYTLSTKDGKVLQKGPEDPAGVNVSLQYMSANENGLLVVDDRTGVRLYGARPQRDESEKNCEK